MRLPLKGSFKHFSIYLLNFKGQRLVASGKAAGQENVALFH